MENFGTETGKGQKKKKIQLQLDDQLWSMFLSLDALSTIKWKPPIIFCVCFCAFLPKHVTYSKLPLRCLQLHLLLWLLCAPILNIMLDSILVSIFCQLSLRTLFFPLLYSFYNFFFSISFDLYFFPLFSIASSFLSLSRFWISQEYCSCLSVVAQFIFMCQFVFVSQPSSLTCCFNFVVVFLWFSNIFKCFLYRFSNKIVL